MKGVIIKRYIIKALAIAALYTFFVIPSSSELPMKFIYQGNLREKGILVTGTRQMQFALYETATSTTPIWISTPTDVSISTGVFRVIIEPTIDRRYLENILFLELTVSGQKLAPREMILPSVYSLNTLYHEGKRYSSSSIPPPDAEAGDLWFNTLDNNLYYYNGAEWLSLSRAEPQPHHLSHEPGGSDVITRLSTITFEGDIVISTGYSIRSLSSELTVSTNVVITGYLSVSSTVYADSFVGKGYMITDINGANIVNGTITRAKLAPCPESFQLLIYNGSEWICGTLSLAMETDPRSIHNYNITGSSEVASFWISSGTLDNLYVLGGLDVYQTARFNPSLNGLFITSSGNVGIGISNPQDKLSVVGGVDINSGGKDAIKVDGFGNVGIGTDEPQTKFEVVGEDQAGLISVYKAGDKRIGFFRRK